MNRNITIGQFFLAIPVILTIFGFTMSYVSDGAKAMEKAEHNEKVITKEIEDREKGDIHMYNILSEGLSKQFEAHLAPLNKRLDRIEKNQDELLKTSK